MNDKLNEGDVMTVDMINELIRKVKLLQQKNPRKLVGLMWNEQWNAVVPVYKNQDGEYEADYNTPWKAPGSPISEKT